MSRAHSISTRRRYGMARVCEIWGMPRPTVYRHRGPAEGSGVANTPRPPRRRGPQGACSDAALLVHIRAVIDASPFSGEGYRKVWARLRAQDVRTAARRVRRVMKAGNLLAPQRPVQRDAHPDLQIKERALARTAPITTKPGRFQPNDKLLAFLEAL
jgi:putative transposase